MSQQIINIGQSANDRSGDPLRIAFDKVNQNFHDLYTQVGGLELNAVIPSQSGNNGKYLTTNGSSLHWGTVSAEANTGNYLFDGNNLYTNHSGETIISNGSWNAEDANADIRLPDKTEGGDIYLQNSSGGGVFLAGGSGSLNVAANGKIYISSSVIDGHAPAAWISAGADTILDSNGTVYTFGKDGTITVPPGKITTPVLTAGTTRLFDVPNPDMISGSLYQWHSFGTWGNELYSSGVVLEDVSTGATVQVIDSASGIVISSSTINGIGAQVTFSTHEALTGIGDGTFIRIIPLNYVPAVLHSYKISTGDYSNWIFSNDGILRLPNGATLGNSVFSGDPLGHTAVMSTYSGRNTIYVQDSNAAIQTSGDGSTYNTWTFGNDGTLSLPDIGGYSIIQSIYGVELKAGIHSLLLDSSGNLTLDGNINSLKDSIAIGMSAGSAVVGGVSIGYQAGQTSQGNYGVAIGANAGKTSQQSGGIAIGNAAGYDTQGGNAIAIGASAGQISQSGTSIAIGPQAGYNTQGAHAIAIGAGAGKTNQPDRTIIINATESDFNGVDAQTDSFYVKPVRSVAGGAVPSGFYPTYYNPTTGEFIVVRP